MSCIPAGEFIRGSDEHLPNEKPKATVFIEAFLMDQYEVTNADLKECLDAGRCTDCIKSGKCKKVLPNYGARYSAPDQPAVGVSWYSAAEYCAFKGKRLPTEAEWEKASRGTDGRIYPWGNEKGDCSKAVIEVDGRKGCWDKKIEPNWYMTTRPVGTKPANQYGLYDMAGNAWEWVDDWYSDSYEACGKLCAGRNPKGACAGQESCAQFGNKKIVKGGAWWWPEEYSRASYRRSHIPGNFPEYHHFSFRCAKSAIQ
jgi:formylglycine-generating enzyme required for sulfatase activity